MEPYYADATVTVYAGDCLDVLRELPDASVDAVVTDPPYGLEFMGKEWDAPWRDAGAKMGRGGSTAREGVRGEWVSERPTAYRAGLPFQQWCQLWAAECLRVLKPGGHLLAFGGTRTSHRLACAVEDAGFEIRDSIAWLYGSGFPKSLDVSKAIDKTAGAEREVVGVKPGDPLRFKKFKEQDGNERTTFGADITAPATPDAERWQGWGTALKPAFEIVVVARKPLAGTVAANVLAWGTGALNVDGCRVAAGQDYLDKCASVVGLDSNRNGDAYGEWTGVREDSGSPAGRWPPNVCLDESQAAALDLMSGEQRDGVAVNRNRDGSDMASWYGTRNSQTGTDLGYGGEGGASRFFFVAPLDELDSRFRYTAKAPTDERPRIGGISHPTTKPLSLMRWLVRLVTPPGGVVLEPFAGSGTTVEACILEGFRCIAVEREADYLPLIVQRINRRRDPVAAVRSSGEDGGLFDLLDGGAA